VCGPLWPIGDDASPGKVERENAGSRRGLRCTTVAGEGGKVADFPISLCHI
jgi:hypothetical protein